LHSFINKCLIAAVVVSAVFITSPNGEARPKGRLVIIGGGERTDEIMKKFIALAGGKNATIVVFPMASTVSEEVGKEQAEQIRALGVKEAFYLNINADAANQDSTVAKLAHVTGVFYSGGDQVLLTGALLHTKVQERIQEIYCNGGVVGGTSAGAAVMSRIMLTGNELLNKDSTASFFSLLKDNIETKEGFGFVTDAIIDQHFVVRRRHNRLLSVVLQHPHLVGVGIDEATSIIVNPNNTFTVLGESVVVVYDATKSRHVRVNKNKYLTAENMSFHILQSGDSFNLNTKRVTVHGR
jgi:cyanophycinase